MSTNNNNQGMYAISSDTDKKTVFQTVRNQLEEKGLVISGMDDNRPWGGFFVIDEASLDTFIDLFFSDFQLKKENEELQLSPKVLLVERGKRLSWQYHHRRSEAWKIISGPVGIIMSETDEQKPVQTFETGDLVTIEQGKRHRLVGLDEWGIVAEIWKHTDQSNPSEEDDIVRLDDDFGR